jgi:hypothetical protein
MKIVPFVIPGLTRNPVARSVWIPAFAGMTGNLYFHGKIKIIVHAKIQENLVLLLILQRSCDTENEHK